MQPMEEVLLLRKKKILTGWLKQIRLLPITAGSWLIIIMLKPTGFRKKFEIRSDYTGYLAGRKEVRDVEEEI